MLLIVIVYVVDCAHIKHISVNLLFSLLFVIYFVFGPPGGSRMDVSVVCLM